MLNILEFTLNLRNNFNSKIQKIGNNNDLMFKKFASQEPAY